MRHLRRARSAYKGALGTRRCARRPAQIRVPRPLPGSGPARASESSRPVRPAASHRSRSYRQRARRLDGPTPDCAQAREREPRRARSASAPPATMQALSSRDNTRDNRVRDGRTVARGASAGDRSRRPRDLARGTRLARKRVAWPARLCPTTSLTRLDRPMPKPRLGGITNPRVRGSSPASGIHEHHGLGPVVVGGIRRPAYAAADDSDRARNRKAR
jgi:hypothetical protein